MSNLFLRAALAGCATAAAAVAQTQPVPPPIAVPVPVPTATFVARVASPAQGKMILKTVEVGDLVCPPADCPLAKPGTDPAMQAAAKAFTEVRAEELMKAVKTGTDRGWWDEYGGGGKLMVTTDGKSLIVNNTAAVVDKVEACVGSIRKLRNSQVKVDVILFTVPSKNEAVAKLFGDKTHAAVKADEMKLLLRELKASGQADILSRPTLLVLNKQTGFFMVGGGQPVPTPAGEVVACQPFGVSTRVTPDVSADLKSVALALELDLNERTAGPLPGVSCQQVRSNVVLPDGGTMLVKVGTRKVESKSENKVPVVGDLPYVGRLFTNIGVSQVPTDTVAVITATRVHDSPAVASPVMNWAVTPPMMPTATPVALPPAMAAPVPVYLPTARPVPVPTVAPSAVYPHPMPVTRTVGPDGLERVGVHFDTLTTASTLPKATGGVRTMTAPAGATVVRFTTPVESCVAGGCIGTAIGRTTYDFKFANDAVVPVAGRACDVDPSDVLMAAYKAACAAGRKEEAARLALQLLAEDPTCFGK